KEKSNIKLVQLELSSQKDNDSIPAQITEILGQDAVIDVFLANAGINGYMGPTLTATDGSKWESVYKINSLAPILTFQKLYPFLQKSETKQAIFTSSLLGSIAGYIPFHTSSYGQSKSALNYSVKALSEELKDQGFVILSIHPGLVATDMAKNVTSDLDAFPMISDLKAAEKQVALFKKLDSGFNGKFWDVDSDKEYVF
ncbi:hypothetical protein WICPIJ_006715, partial [Wickerhamomyces pijperi]